jgi:H+/Cl- antiporter ClcA
MWPRIRLLAVVTLISILALILFPIVGTLLCATDTVTLYHSDLPGHVSGAAEGCCCVNCIPVLISLLILVPVLIGLDLPIRASLAVMAPVNLPHFVPPPRSAFWA